ncbi:endonuclease [Gordonia phage Cozz]|uniref:Holliday junction resolvase n=3 Tax=Emalynvirus cozz TaxID=2560490 RepID=A0A4Y5NZD5_9CAUD|nr:endonuclease [Gordonia phage Cozz]AZS11790.1 holliday junction resolvase [Gordonia phage Nina]QCW22368.1 holliday junction resolvase [Gordonia phage Agatha]QDM56313.1 holliday junction resolvase [Gordonia phage SweatNTears]QGH76664.1 holliday junction resolvase [Gordonia phage Quasar]ANA85741.1 holliday junction resolvase [Gordonia phage Cozz]
MSQPEARLGRQIRKALEERGAFMFKIHGGPTMMAGLPDLIGVWHGRFIAVEVKMPGNGPSKIQERVMDRIRQAGGRVVVAHSVPEALEVLRPRRD